MTEMVLEVTFYDLCDLCFFELLEKLEGKRILILSVLDFFWVLDILIIL